MLPDKEEPLIEKDSKKKEFTEIKLLEHGGVLKKIFLTV